MNHRHAVSKLAPVISLAERRARLVPIAVELRQKQAHHDIILEALITAYREGSWTVVIEEWRYLEPSLRAQMDREEHGFLSAFRCVMRDDADELIAQHEELREMLDVVGLGMDVRSVGAADLDALLTTLREYAGHAEEHFYPWLDERTSAKSDPERAAAAWVADHIDCPRLVVREASQVSPSAARSGPDDGAGVACGPRCAACAETHGLHRR